MEGVSCETPSELYRPTGTLMNRIAEHIRLGKNTKCHADAPMIFTRGRIGDNVKIENDVFIPEGVVIEDGVFIGPGVIFTNDKIPRAINPDGSLKSSADWNCEQTLVKHGASIGAGAIICPGITIGRFAFVCAGTVVTRDVADWEKVKGNPMHHAGEVCDRALYDHNRS